MKICQKCNNTFPSTIVFEGKRYCLNRKFCLTCSPFKGHNTKNLSHRTTNTKICCSCGIDKSLTEFYLLKGTSTRYYSYCKVCSIDRSKNKSKHIKQIAVEYKGGRCIICNYSKCLSALEFHHLDPTQKDFSLAQTYLGNIEKIKKELDKCVLVCANCHREIHSGLILVGP